MYVYEIYIYMYIYMFISAAAHGVERKKARGCITSAAVLRQQIRKPSWIYIREISGWRAVAIYRYTPQHTSAHTATHTLQLPSFAWIYSRKRNLTSCSVRNEFGVLSSSYLHRAILQWYWSIYAQTASLFCQIMCKEQYCYAESKVSHHMRPAPLHCTAKCCNTVLQLLHSVHWWCVHTNVWVYIYIFIYLYIHTIPSTNSGPPHPLSPVTVIKLGIRHARKKERFREVPSLALNLKSLRPKPQMDSEPFLWIPECAKEIFEVEKATPTAYLNLTKIAALFDNCIQMNIKVLSSKCFLALICRGCSMHPMSLRHLLILHGCMRHSLLNPTSQLVQ